MSNKYPVYKGLDLSQVNKDVLKTWDDEDTFHQSITLREGAPDFVFYEGPPSANGMPGIHHVMGRSIKDIFCRFKTQKGFRVHRKAGWDTHGLPVELGVESLLGITKEDIGKTISIQEYNDTCRREVMKYTDVWEDLTRKMGYWVNMDDPYVTYDNRYIETLWWLLKQLYNKGLLYKGYTIQPYSPAAGTGLSTHELNQPGCYRDVKDTTAVGQFTIVKNDASAFLFSDEASLCFLAWTTTPWTLPSNTALAIGANITYVKVKSFNPYTFQPVSVILAKDRLSAYFNPKNADLKLSDYQEGNKAIPFEVVAEYKGSELVGVTYEQLIPFVKPQEPAFKVIAGDFVTTEDGTGIVHIAPTFGADDDRVAKQSGIPPMLLLSAEGEWEPMVDKTGKFFKIEDLDADFVKDFVNVDLYSNYAGRFVKNAYDETLTEKDVTLDIDLSIWLKTENKAFKVEKYEHTYPHCWRTDKPVLYYPLDSWFIKTTAMRDRLIELNKTINWKPESTGTGRFGKWLENLVDWNLSRSRFWGTPLPIWRTEDGSEEVLIGSVEELNVEIQKAIGAGFMESNPLDGFIVGDNTLENYNKIDLHRHVVDHVILVSASGKPMKRESDLIDVWFDSGAMPYAQIHYPFENKDAFKHVYPADFIAEGVDQTRGWFFTLHALAVMLFDSVAFKNIISNGLVLDKNGNKMSKRLGNGVDPFEVIEKYGSDCLRWYMITNAQPWDNLKFDIEGIEEVRRKFFGTLYNTYSFFALYANIDGFHNQEAEISVDQRPEIDRWIISLLNSLVKEVGSHYENYEPTRAGRAIQDFVTENLSNWYVRLNRKRYWGGEYNADKIAAYQTLHTCITTIAQLMAPIAPFYADKLYRDLNLTADLAHPSVHINLFPGFEEKWIDKALEKQMDIAQQVSSMILSLRRKVSIKVRQPLNKILIPVLDEQFIPMFEAVKGLVLTEVNVKEVEYLTEDAGILVKKIKPNFKTLGPKYGKIMKQIAGVINGMSQEDINAFERAKEWSITVGNEQVLLSAEDVEIISEDIPGWLVASADGLTVALDVNITEDLHQEGIAREVVNKVQNLRKDSGFEVTDKIKLSIGKNNVTDFAVNRFKEYIGSQTLADVVVVVDADLLNNPTSIEIDKDVSMLISVEIIA